MPFHELLQEWQFLRLIDFLQKPIQNISGKKIFLYRDFNCRVGEAKNYSFRANFLTPKSQNLVKHFLKRSCSPITNVCAHKILLKFIHHSEDMAVLPKCLCLELSPGRLILQLTNICIIRLCKDNWLWWPV